MNSLLFISDQTHQDLIRGLYRLRKSENRKFSLAYLCLRSGIPSKGYLSDVTKSKRSLNPKYALPLGQALGLVGLQLKFFDLLVRRDHERDPNTRKKLEQKLESVGKSLRVKRVQLKSTPDLRLISRIFCLCGLIGSPVTIRKLRVAIPNLSEGKIKQAMDQLESTGAVTKVDGAYKIAETQLVFPSSDDPAVLNDFFQASISDAATAIHRWFPHPEKSYFQSTIVSVNRKAYLAKLSEIKQFFDGIQSDLESTDADALVYFNIQIYPEE